MSLDGPILDKITLKKMDTDNDTYPFNVSIIKKLETLTFNNQVTFFVGENGSGKSTLLESLALKAGFGREGGSKNINFNTVDEKHTTPTDLLADTMTLSWRKKPRDGYFFRGDSFFNLANHIDYLAKEGGQGSYVVYADYGGKSLHAQSHGESFLSFFKNRLSGGGLYILDEPEVALSPKNQLGLLRIISDLSKNPESQFIIATHSPILLAYPNATIYSCDGDTLSEVAYNETSSYELTKGFLDNPDVYLRHLLKD